MCLDAAGRVRDVSQTASELVGRKRASLAGASFAGFVGADRREGFLAAVGRCVRQRQALAFETSLAPAAGPPVPVCLCCVPVPDAAGDGDLCAAAIFGLTDGKRTQEMLRQSEARLRATLDAARNISLITADLGGAGAVITDVNSGAERIFGYERRELVGKPLAMLHRPEDVAAFDEVTDILRSHKAGRSTETVLVRKGGEEFPALLGVYPLFDEGGEVTRLLGVSVDISKRTRAEDGRQWMLAILERLNAEGEKDELIRGILQVIQEFTGVEAVAVRLREGEDFPYFASLGFPDEFVEAERSLCALDSNGEIVRDADGSASLECLCGDVIARRTDASLPCFTRAGSFWARRASELPPAVTARAGRPRIRPQFDGRRYESMALIPLRSGEETIGLLQLCDRRTDRLGPELIQLLEGIAASVGIALARKQAEEALRANEHRFRTIVETFPGVVWMTEKGWKRRPLYLSDAVEPMFGYPKMAFMEGWLCLADLAFAEDLEPARAAVQGAMAQKGPYTVECRFGRADGTTVWVQEMGEGVYDARGELQYVVGTMLDITDGKRAEEALAESEAKYRTLVEDIPAVTYLAALDDASTTLYVSPQIEAILGVTPADYRQDPDLWRKRLHPDDRQRVMAEVARCHGSGEPLVMDYRMMTPGGREVWVHDEGRIVRDEAGTPLYLLGVMYDVTASKQGEQKLRTSRERLRALAARLQSIREEERTRLARRIHDDMGHALAALKMDLSWLARKLEQAGEVSRLRDLRQRIDSMSGLVDDTIRAARETASDLRPGVLDDLGLTAALEWAVGQFQTRTGTACTFASSARDVELDRERSTALYRICRELLTNVVRHAGATAVTVALKRHGEQLSLEVSDNGRGITAEQVSSSGSLGILGMRERALLLGGRLSISGGPGRGTRAVVRIPLDVEGRAEGDRMAGHDAVRRRRRTRDGEDVPGSGGFAPGAGRQNDEDPDR